MAVGVDQLGTVAEFVGHVVAVGAEACAEVRHVLRLKVEDREGVRLAEEGLESNLDRAAVERDG